MARISVHAAVVAVVLATAWDDGLAFADPPLVATVVLHVTDVRPKHAGVPAVVQEAVNNVYADIGVRLLWVDGPSTRSVPDGATHVDVILLTAASDRSDADTTVLGKASPETKRVYVFYSRVVKYSMQSGSLPAPVFALVLAHELGHALLPRPSHARSGLMRAQWTGRILWVPAFAPQQAATIRTLLVAAQ